MRILKKTTLTASAFALVVGMSGISPVHAQTFDLNAAAATLLSTASDKAIETYNDANTKAEALRLLAAQSKALDATLNPSPTVAEQQLGAIQALVNAVANLGKKAVDAATGGDSGSAATATSGGNATVSIVPDLSIFAGTSAVSNAAPGGIRDLTNGAYTDKQVVSEAVRGKTFVGVNAAGKLWFNLVNVPSEVNSKNFIFSYDEDANQLIVQSSINEKVVWIGELRKPIQQIIEKGDAQVFWRKDAPTYMKTTVGHVERNTAFSSWVSQTPPAIPLAGRSSMIPEGIKFVAGKVKGLDRRTVLDSPGDVTSSKKTHGHGKKASKPRGPSTASLLQKLTQSVNNGFAALTNRLNGLDAKVNANSAAVARASCLAENSGLFSSQSSCN